MGCCVQRDEQFNLNISPKNKTRNSIITSHNVTPSMRKNVQFTLSNLENGKESDDRPGSSKLFFLEKEFSKFNKTSFVSNANLYDQPTSNRDFQASVLDKSEITKKFTNKNLNYGVQNHLEPSIFQEFLLSNKNVAKMMNLQSPNFQKEITAVTNLRESINDEGKISIIKPSYLTYKHFDNENVDYFMHSPKHKPLNHIENNNEMLRSFQGDTISRKEELSYRDIDIIASERKSIIDSTKPYKKKDIQIIRKDEISLKEKEKRNNKIKEKAYEPNNTSVNQRKENSHLENRVAQQIISDDISASSNRGILNKYIHLFGDIDNYGTNNSKTNRSIYDTNREDVVEGDITNIKISGQLNSSNIQSKLQRINLALSKRNFSEGKDMIKKGDFNFNSGLFNGVSKSVNKNNFK